MPEKKPWERYASDSEPTDEGFWSKVLKGTAKSLQTRPEQVSGSLLDGGFKIREKTPEEEKLGPTVAAKRAGRWLGIGQGAVADPIMAGAQLLGYNDPVQQYNQGYENLRKNLGQEGFDYARLGGNIISPVSVKGSQAINKGFQMWGKKPGLFKQGATQGGFAGLTQPVLNDPNAPIDPETNLPEEKDLLTEKLYQTGSGVLFGGALNKLIGRGGQQAYANVSKVPATASQLANQSKVPVNLSQVEEYRQLFPGADLTWGQQLGPRANVLEQKLTSVPFIGDIITRAREKSLQSQNVAMMNKALEPAQIKLEKGAKAGRGMFDDAYQKLSSKYDEVLDKAALHNPDVLRSKVYGTMSNGVYMPGAISDDYAKLSEKGKETFDRLIEEGLFKRFGKDPTGTHSVRMTGRQFKNHEEGMKNIIDDYMNGVGEERSIGRMLKTAMGEAYQSLEGATPEVSKQLKNLNKAYAQYKTLETASTASAGSGGVFNPLQTIKASTKGNRGAVARGKGLLQPEAELSQDVLGRVYPDSGTAGRLMGANPFVQLAGGALGLPLELLYSPKFTTLATQGGKRLGRKIEGTRVGSALADQADKITPATTRWFVSPPGSEEETGYRRGGRVQRSARDEAFADYWRQGYRNEDDEEEDIEDFFARYADGGQVQWSDVAGSEQELTDPREIAYGQPLEDVTFIGSASKIFRPKLMRYAEKMEKAGKTPEEIWQKTMTARLPKTGQWAQEIPDTYKDLKLHGAWSKDYSHMDKLVKADKLFEAYPDLRQQFARNNPNMRGYGSHQSRETVLPGDDKVAHLFDLNLNLMRKKDYDPHSTLAHEIQHYVQAKEKWPMGGSLETGADIAFQRGKGKPVISPEETKVIQNNIEFLKNLQSKVASQPRHKGQTKMLRDLSNEINNAEHLLKSQEGKVAVSAKDADDHYRRLAGEMQARLTQRRLGLTAKERKQYYPFQERSEANPWGYDLPVEEMITTGYKRGGAVGYDDGGEVKKGKDKNAWLGALQNIRDELLKTPSVVEDLGRGAVMGIPGSPGDVSEFGRMLAPETMHSVFGERVLPTSEELLKRTPRMFPADEYSGAVETAGSFLSPGVIAKAVTKVPGMALKALGPEKYEKAFSRFYRPEISTEATVNTDKVRTLMNASQNPTLEAMSLERFKKAADPALLKDMQRRQGVWLDETNPMFISRMPRSLKTNIADNPELLRKMAQTAENLEQEGASIARAVPLPTKDITKANALILRKGKKGLSDKDIADLSKTLKGRYGIQHRADEGALLFPISNRSLGVADKMIAKRFPEMTRQRAMSSPDVSRVYATRTDQGWAPHYGGLGAVSRELNPQGRLTSLYDDYLQTLGHRDLR